MAQELDTNLNPARRPVVVLTPDVAGRVLALAFPWVAVPAAPGFPAPCVASSSVDQVTVLLRRPHTASQPAVAPCRSPQVPALHSSFFSLKSWAPASRHHLLFSPNGDPFIVAASLRCPVFCMCRARYFPQACASPVSLLFVELHRDFSSALCLNIFQ